MDGSASRRLHSVLVSLTSAASDADDAHRGSTSSALRSALTSNNIELVPFGFESGLFSSTREGKQHVRWLMQKYVLGQDVMLLGPGGPLRRWLALHFCATTGREVEYVAITRDTTESDLKQRREIVAGGTAVYVDQAVVQAAIHGRVLILEGLEHAERNVLPVLNNLLENREMALEDGRFLVSPNRFDSLTFDDPPPPGDSSSRSDSLATSATTALEAKSRRTSQLVRVHPAFRVIAIGLPVPPFAGNPLDPPLRSRFQSRRIDPLSNPALLALVRDTIAPTAPIASIQRLLSFAESLRIIGANQASMAGVEKRAIAFHHLPYLTESGVLAAARLIELFPALALSNVIERVYPWRFAISNSEAYELVATLALSLQEKDEPFEQHQMRHYVLDSITVRPMQQHDTTACSDQYSSLDTMRSLAATFHFMAVCLIVQAWTL
jgi:von Willebrand factor A domain-containing protein 8